MKDIPTSTYYAKLAFKAIADNFKENEPMDGDFTEDICKILLKRLDDWQGNT